MKKVLIVVGVFIHSCVIGGLNVEASSQHLAAMPSLQEKAARPQTVDSDSSEVPQDWLSTVQAQLEKAEYNVSYDDAKTSYQSPNRANNTRAYYSPGTLTLQNRIDSAGHNWEYSVTTQGIAADGALLCVPTENVAPQIKDNVIEYHYLNYTEQYINTAEGTRQNFIIQTTPSGTQSITITLSTNGLQVNQVTDNELHLYNEVGGKKEVRLIYRDLKSWDANGKLLGGKIVAQGNQIQLQVDATDAVYPIMIDPVYAHYSPILSQGQAYARFGYSVSGAGDVNGDGYDDVIIGAYYYDHGHTNEGAAFVYHGSSTGLSVIMTSQLECNQVSAVFGWSVSSAGDVNGDGYDDVIVGARFYDNGQAFEGAAFVYHGSATGIDSGAVAAQLECNQASAYFGYSVSSAGDVNGDGYDDVIVGARYYDNGQASEGAAFVYHGSATGIDSGAIAAQLECNQADALFGVSVSSAGDVNGDGYDDVIVGADGYDNGQSGEGAAFVYHGSATGIDSGVVASQLECNQVGALLGVSVSSAGDVNGDGYDDVIVGADGYDNGQSNEGAAFVYHGSATGIDSGVVASQLEYNQAFARFGKSVSGAGDVNGDGYDDVIIGAYQYDNGESNEGVSFLYHGSASGIDSSKVASQLEQNQAFARFGFSVAGAGDVNGDGYSDVIAGTYYYDNGQNAEGAAFVYYGSYIGLAIDSSDMVDSDQASSYFGVSVSSAGDVNGDGYSDVIVGAYLYDNGQSDEGVAFIYHGTSTGLSHSIHDTLQENQASAYFGSSVSTAGDVNGDGYSDVIVGAPSFDHGQSNEGASFIYHGSSTGIDTAAAAQLECNQSSANFGYSVSSAGDVNGDGYSDVIVGASEFEHGQGVEGGVFIYHGSATGVDSATVAEQLEQNQFKGHFGTSVACAGDVNGDGYSDIIIGAPDYDHGQGDEGAAFVYHGSATGIDSGAVAEQLECNQSDASFGTSVSSAGDVNGDGYADVIVGASGFSNGQSSEGGAFVYHGSSTGIDSGAIAEQLEINQANANFGTSVSGVGDVNGDSYADVIVGARRYDNGEPNEGGAFVYHGSSSGVSSAPAVQLESNQANANFGESVSAAGDINGDGYSDIVVGAGSYDNGHSNEGAIFVYMGSATGLDSTTIDVQLEENQASAEFGYSVSSAGDVNGDGYSDLIVGASYYDNGQNNEGAAFVYHGSSSGLSTTATSLLECNQAAASFGYSVSSAGDVNGDGFDDVIVGGNYYDNGHTNEGAAFVFHGSASGVSAALAAQLECNQVNAHLGGSVSGAGDVNGDGYSDIIVGATGHSNGQTYEGGAFVYHGSSSGIDSGSVAAQLECNQAIAHLGGAVSGAGDVNGDGYSDVIVGATGHNNGQSNEGGAFVYHGSSTGIDSSTVATQLESNQISAYFGKSVSSAGDVNGDGYSDVIVGADGYDNGGAAFVYHGGSTGISTTTATQLECNSSGAYFGRSVSSAGDVNGDGYSDVIVGAYWYDNGQSHEGAAFVYHGSSTGTSTTIATQFESNQVSAEFGKSVSCAGDVNGDGYDDVIVGAWLYDNGHTDEGAAFVYYGNAGGGMKNYLVAYDDDTTKRYDSTSLSDVNLGIGLYAKSPLGRQKGKIAYETIHEGEGYSTGSPITNSTSYTGQSSSYSDLGLAGKELKEVIAKETSNLRTRVRARVKYDPVTAITGQVYGPWRYITDFGYNSLGFLPVEWSFFTAEKCNDEQDALLRWATASEENSKGFTIQRSADNEHWKDIGYRKGQGNSQFTTEYSYTDENPLLGQNYYRLIQTDFDGHTSPSDVRMLYFGNLNGMELLVYPNPSQGIFTVHTDGLKGELLVQDMTGKVLQAIVVSDEESSILLSLSDFSKGVYILTFVAEDRSLSNQKITVY